jgi:hypothetical protein
MLVYQSRLTVLSYFDGTKDILEERFLMEQRESANFFFLKTTGFTPVSSGKDVTPSQNIRAAVVVPSDLPVL